MHLKSRISIRLFLNLRLKKLKTNNALEYSEPYTFNSIWALSQKLAMVCSYQIKDLCMQISEQIVLVTGGARGLGLAISQALIAEGAQVVVNYLSSQTAAQQLARHFPQQVFTYQADVTDKAQVEQLFAAAKAHFGASITSVVNNALIDFQFNGDARPKIAELTAQNLQQQFNGAVVAALNTTQAALADMQNAQGLVVL